LQIKCNVTLGAWTELSTDQINPPQDVGRFGGIARRILLADAVPPDDPADAACVSAISSGLPTDE